MGFAGGAIGAGGLLSAVLPEHWKPQSMVGFAGPLQGAEHAHHRSRQAWEFFGFINLLGSLAAVIGARCWSARRRMTGEPRLFCSRC